MKVLSAENNISYTSNNAVKIYIIKQVDISELTSFINTYHNLIKSGTDVNSAIRLDKNIVNPEKKIQLTQLYSYVDLSNQALYTRFNINKDSIDNPAKFENIYFLTSLCELRSCPLLDFSKVAYVFQIEGQATGGLANVISFNVNFNVNGQSSAEVVLNNKDFLYNFKNFGDKTKYNMHLKSYFDPNDIIIIRCQKRNIQEDSLINSFIPSSLNYWKDSYINGENDPFRTVFTGYINDINNSFSFTNGQQVMSLNCTGPSKKLTWTRVVTNQAMATKDSYSAILPLSAFVNPQALNEDNKVTLSNEDVVKNVIVRTYSGLLNIPEIKQAYDNFTNAFDKANSIQTDNTLAYLNSQIKELQEKQVKNEISVEEQKLLQNLIQQLNTRLSTFRKQAADFRKRYNDLVDENFSKFVTYDTTGTISIKKHLFLNSEKFKSPTLFVINGTKQPAYQYVFQNYSSLFTSDYSTVYQFIKTISDNLQFNFYDDPCGIIHFEVPDMTLSHLYKETDPNNLQQISSFSETQNTENIANIQIVEAKYTYDVPMSFITSVNKDYHLMELYGEKMMQPFSAVGITNVEGLKYAGKMKMAKYNRKALSNIRINMNGDPGLQLGKYAYIKSLRKLFYVESYSHVYNAGGDFSTSLNGTYTRDILTYVEIKDPKMRKNVSKVWSEIPFAGATSDINSTFNKRLSNASTTEEVNKLLDMINFNKSDAELSDWIYNLYVQNWNYPKNNEDLKIELSRLYKKNNLRTCYLDDFLWAIPFDVDPYETAKQIQKEEQEAAKNKSITLEIKSNKPKLLNSNSIKNNVPEYSLPSVKLVPISDANVTTKITSTTNSGMANFKNIKEAVITPVTVNNNSKRFEVVQTISMYKGELNK